MGSFSSHKPYSTGISESATQFNPRDGVTVEKQLYRFTTRVAGGGEWWAAPFCQGYVALDYVGCEAHGPVTWFLVTFRRSKRGLESVES